MEPRLLTPEQKEIRMNISADILQNTENDPKFLENVIIRDKSWFFLIRPRKERANPCTGKASVNQGRRKHGRANPDLNK
jgi:hypothetical protein